jgi:hypothetical protein
MQNGTNAAVVLCGFFSSFPQPSLTVIKPHLIASHHNSLVRVIRNIVGMLRNRVSIATIFSRKTQIGLTMYVAIGGDSRKLLMTWKWGVQKMIKNE